MCTPYALEQLASGHHEVFDPPRFSAVSKGLCSAGTRRKHHSRGKYLHGRRLAQGIIKGNTLSAHCPRDVFSLPPKTPTRQSFRVSTLFSDLRCRIYSPCVAWRNDATATLDLASRWRVTAHRAIATAAAIMAAIHATADRTDASRDLLPPTYAYKHAWLWGYAHESRLSRDYVLSTFVVTMVTVTIVPIRRGGGA